MNEISYLDLSEIIAFAFTGAAASFGYGEPIRPRGRMWGTAFSSTITGTAFGVLLVFFFPQYHDAIRWIALVLSLFARWYMPAFVERIPGVVGAALAKFLPAPKEGEK